MRTTLTESKFAFLEKKGELKHSLSHGIFFCQDKRNKDDVPAGSWFVHGSCHHVIGHSLLPSWTLSQLLFTLEPYIFGIH